MYAELIGIYTRFLKPDKGADVQERCIQLMAYHFEMSDHTFKAYVMEKVQDWSDISDRNETTEEHEKDRAREMYEVMIRLLLPQKPPALSRA